MAGSASATGTSAADFERMRLAHVSAITEDLHEAADLLSQLNKNLAYWAEKTGEVEKLALVWGKFQNQLSVLSRVMYGQSDPEDTANETTGPPTALSNAWTSAPGAASSSN